MSEREIKGKATLEGDDRAGRDDPDILQSVNRGAARARRFRTERSLSLPAPALSGPARF